MASYTSFLNLEKPTTSERLDVLKINSNWDKIDAGVSALNSHLGKFKTKSLTGTAGNTGALNTNIPNTNIILGQKVNNTSNNITLSGFVSFNGYWYIQTEANVAVDITLMYYEP